MIVGKTVALYYGSESKSYQFNVVKGIYKIECWGAKGYLCDSKGGCGGYVSGFIKINEPIPLYIYPGGEGVKAQGNHSFNGGGTSQCGGGGGSDVRLIGGDWNLFESLKSRIIVAGGGGGKDNWEISGAGGGLVGLQPDNEHGYGGTQTSGGISEYGSGEFGIGGSNSRTESQSGSPNDGNGAGGGGYFGGSASIFVRSYSGAGGSSFISGHAGCNAINETSTDPKAMIPTNQSIHYSGYRFFNTNIIDGISNMPAPTGGFEIGHCSYGAVKIQLFTLFSCQKQFQIPLNSFRILIFIYFTPN